MFNPPNISFLKKKHKHSILGIETRANRVIHGFYGIKTAEGGYLTSKQIEAVRKVIVKQMKKVGRVYIRIYPHLAITNKPAETRMGKGKGNIVYWTAPVKSGRMLFEIDGVSRQKAKEILLFAGAKLPVKIRFVVK